MEILTPTSDDENVPDWNALAAIDGYMPRLRLVSESCRDLTLKMVALFNAGKHEQIVQLYHKVLRSDHELLDFYIEWLAKQDDKNPRDWRNCIRHQMRMAVTLGF